MNQAMVIDDDEDYRNLLTRKLARAYPGLVIHEIDPLAASLPGEDYSWDDIDFIILDYQLGLEYTGLDWFKQFKTERMPATILLTARGSEELAVRAIKLGIDDYIVKEHFNNEALINSIDECVHSKREEKARLKELSLRNIVFDKSRFIHRLGLIIRDKDTRHHLFMVNPTAYQEVGKQAGIGAQDKYINYITDLVYQYLSSKKIGCNIFKYKDEYVAVIIEANSYKRHLKYIYKKLNDEIIQLGLKKYSCAASIGVVTPSSLDSSEFIKSDFELLDIAHILCDSAKSRKKERICHYGDINIGDVWYLDGEPITTHTTLSYDMEKAIADGRVNANYQPWAYIASDETKDLKDVYDVRIEVIDLEGKRISKGDFLNLISDAFSKRLVDRWILRNTVAFLNKETEENNEANNIKLAVKITLGSISDPLFIPWITKLFDYSYLPSGCLLFDIESAHFMRNKEQYITLINEVAGKYDIKCILSGINDIDTYYQVAAIQKFDIVKLNVRDLIYGFPRNPLKRLINTIKDDNTRIVAIKVSDAEELNLVSSFNIDYVHGYLVGKPYTDLIADREVNQHYVI
ncbi:MAG: EAL domain-containing protein [Gammaproteobacteria bacterium]